MNARGWSPHLRVDWKGSFNYYFSITNMREADGNAFLYATEHECWTGGFSGTGDATFRVERFSSGFFDVWLRTVFTGTVLDKSGTMVIQLVGKKESEVWKGEWVIVSGTGGLVDLVGQGTWGGTGICTRAKWRVPRMF